MYTCGKGLLRVCDSGLPTRRDLLTADTGDTIPVNRHEIGVRQVYQALSADIGGVYQSLSADIGWVYQSLSADIGEVYELAAR